MYAEQYIPGSELAEECFKIKQENNISELPVGEVVVTKGYNLPHNYVIHTVGPRVGKENINLLANRYLNSLREADRLRAKSISFSAISAGIYGVPIGQSAIIVKKVLQDISINSRRRYFFIIYERK